MEAAQYQITLPADYDMEIIRKRVALGGPILDERAGLGLKAWIIRERGVADSPVNEYAPFYLWNDSGAMAQFLFGGGGFQNILRDFGRPSVLRWTGLACVAGSARDSAPRAATRRLGMIPVDADADGTGMGLAALIDKEIEQLRALAALPGVHTAALGLDPDAWRLVRFVLWRGMDAAAQEEQATERYEVLHVSSPGLEELPQGRSWA
ncbi:hypothetical protein ABIA32_001254 [Streptacidiphilus sp. MAP12-20]|uniref:DUF4865 family protein n=1 Tax=Streptacidiphilus sp. MAP12-20 TaxID=3156299 RepID=UPI0035154AE5